jgi:hypothetical protein
MPENTIKPTQEQIEAFEQAFKPNGTIPNWGPLNGYFKPEELVKKPDSFEQDLIDKDKQALRYNEGKLKWSLVDWKSLEGLVRVLEMGAEKYAPYNWTKGMPVTEVSESLLRHMFAYLNGENEDKESLELHLSHVLCNAMFLIHIMREKPEFDDRTVINKNDNG